ncbi:MAG: serine hydrolase domain-containing protein, partial [Cyclobacteriaceae bacterium]
MKRLFIAGLCIAFVNGVFAQPKVSDPEKLGFNKTTIKQADAVIEKYLDDKLFPGAVALVARKGELVYFKSFGMQDIDKGQEMRQNSLFRIASMTKPITAVAFLKLWEEGKVKLDDPVTKYLPSFGKLKVRQPDGSSVAPDTPLTLRHFFTQSTGLPPLGSSELENVDRSKISTLEEYVDSFLNLPLMHQPDKSFTYSVNMDVIGRIVEIVSGQPFEDYIKQNIFDPLGMENTSYFVPEEKLSRFSSIYKPENGTLKFLAGPTTNPNRFIRASGGLVSSAYDYFLFAQMLLNKGELNGKRILKKETVEMMVTDILPSAIYPLTVMG